jgi:hypothetical protein
LFRLIPVTNTSYIGWSALRRVCSNAASKSGVIAFTASAGLDDMSANAHLAAHEGALQLTLSDMET